MPEINWLKNREPLVEDQQHQVLSNGRFLQIYNVQVANTGMYSCLASNTAGDRSKHFNLNVLGRGKDVVQVTLKYDRTFESGPGVGL